MISNDKEITITNKPTIGERLRNARLGKNLTIADIASELRLTKQTIEHIENEQWSELHGRAYARGYFSSYVKYLGLPEDELLAAFNAEYAIDEPPLKVIHQKIEISNKKFVWLPSVVLVVVAVIGWFAYQQLFNTPEELVIDESSSLFSDSTATNENANKEIEIVVPNESQELNEFDQQVNPNTEQLINDELTKDTFSDKSETVIDQAAADAVAIEQSTQETATTNNDVTTDNSAAITSTNAVLDLRFSDNCWVQVKDADNKILLGKLMTKDNSIVLKGRAPLTVVLGRASAVEVIFNDKVFDPSTFTHKGVAQFTLGAES